jgi:N4-(beta-N-acetylglucosaminyl)-L-asparaginase
VRDAISTARLVMEKTFHTLIVGQDATMFALQNGVPAQSTSSVESSNIWATWIAAGRIPNYRRSSLTAARDLAHLHSHRGHDTIGMIAIQANGSVACGTTTNGASHKVAGRVGDSPIVGSGAYCESAVGGAAGQPAPNAVAGSLDCCDALQPLVMETS